jgi:RNA recognition motif-containing protein
MVRTKVFVGNLSFKTREAELAQEFSAHAKVISANIITRGPRSLGYGFVELESEDEARKAVAAMDKKEIDGRQINVEVAKPREEGEEENKNQQQQTGGSPNANATRGRGGARGAFRGARGTRGGNATRGAFRGGNATNATAAPRAERAPRQKKAAPAEGETEATEGTRPRRLRRNKKEGTQEGEKKPDTRVESQTSLFVANLPFSLTDETFGKVFTDASLKFKKAHVVTKKNGRSKGFGFVEFDSNEDQQKALTALQGKTVEERELILKVALTENEKAEVSEESNKGESKEEEKKN